ncbi:hypothetical protein J437_LFUL005310, partial [Ladona fulva]
MLGMPAEMYVFGTQFWMILVSIVFASFVTGFFFVPVFYQLQLTSSYQGGIKAVVWTDTLQTLIMFGAMILIVIIGTVSVGGPSNVWNLSLKGNRIEFF